MTNPIGVSFVSYRRVRSDEVARLVRAQHDHGIPTWRDVDDLRSEPTEEELVQVLEDPNTANALVWATPEIADSAMVRRVEVPKIHQRWERGDGFFVVPVAAGGSGYDDAGDLLSEFLSLRDFRSWNMEKVAGDPIDDEEAAEIAQAILRRRIQTIEAGLDESAPLTLGIFTRVRAPDVPDLHLPLDWYPRFEGRIAPSTTWKRYLLPALDAIADEIIRTAPGRRVDASGRAGIPSLVALGAAFLEPRGTHLTWLQRIENTLEHQHWSLDEEPEDLQISASAHPSVTDAEDLAVCVSLRADVEPAIKRGQDEGEIPDFRAFVKVQAPDGATVELSSPGQASAAVQLTVDQIRDAQRIYTGTGTIHLFIAAPGGFAVMLGQKFNGFGPVLTYEHEQTDRVGRYCPAALLRPGS